MSSKSRRISTKAITDESLRKRRVSRESVNDILRLNQRFHANSNESLRGAETDDAAKALKSHTPPGTDREADRLARIERLLGDPRQSSVIARYFDDKAYREATVIAQRTNSNPPSK
ncbi:hypothetical protein Pr1d_24100 [Bythopirellula goksoeyrii]|uniref:Uncharacterized protein n=1 Tax=Bythopirellula goksoeyrii TaxID=1400387 RepID=A0A5B9QBG4_9BACT|nr:hypothetical protein Pr1d_24100 [Bythopirellula goksoeyrii]